MQLTGKQHEVLQYLLTEGKNRQKKQIAAAVNSSPEYIGAILTELRKRGLVHTAGGGYMGWWGLSEKGRAVASGDLLDFNEGFLTTEIVESSLILRGISSNPEHFRKFAKTVDMELLYGLAAIYCLRTDLDIPVGKPLNDIEEEQAHQTFGTIIKVIREFE